MLSPQRHGGNSIVILNEVKDLLCTQKQILRYRSE